MCEEENLTISRSLRQRTENPAVAVRPRGRRSLNFKLHEEPNVEDIYRQVNAKTNFNPTPLETIYESPKGKCQGLRDVMGVVKLKRHCRFQPFYNPSKVKVKQRKTRSKKLKRVGTNNTKNYVVTLEQVEKALQYISEDENEENCQPVKVQKLVNFELMRKEDAVNREEKIESAIIEMAPMVVDMKDEETIATLNVPENQNGFLDFESICDLPSPGKLKIDKSKRNKRRSGRIPPLSLSNIFNDSSLEHVDKKICSDNNVNGVSYDHCPMQVDKNATSIDYHSSQDSLPSTSSNFKSSEKTPANKRPKRRNSGINKSIYRSNFVISSPNSNNIDEEENTNSELDNHVNKRLLSPTSLLDQLSLGSPEPFRITGSKKSRRKSARLSFGGDTKPHFGSLWVDSKSPKKDNLHENFNTTPLTTTDDFNSTQCCTKEENAENNLPTKLDSKCLDEVKMDDLEFKDSPILTAIIDCKARLSQNKKFKVRKGSKINLDHFVAIK